jgi:hypothetical protein
MTRKLTLAERFVIAGVNLTQEDVDALVEIERERDALQYRVAYLEQGIDIDPSAWRASEERDMLIRERDLYMEERDQWKDRYHQLKDATFAERYSFRQGLRETQIIQALMKDCDHWRARCTETTDQLAAALKREEELRAEIAVLKGNLQ